MPDSHSANSQRLTRSIRFPGATGAALAARLELPAGESAAFALFAHCFTCSKDLKAVGTLSRALTARGIAVLRFDFTGLGESEGDFADTDFSSNIEDLLAAAEYLRRNYQAPRLLVGHSLGGAAVLAAAERIPESVAVATLGAPSDTEHLRDLLLDRAPEIEERGVADVRLAGRTFTLRKQLLDDLAAIEVIGRLGRLNRALLILHSPVDTVVGIDHARRLYEAAKHPKSFVSLDDADHLLTNPRDARYAGEVLAAWAGRYLEEAGTERPEGHGGEEAGETAWPEADGKKVLVAGGPEGYTQRIRVRAHTLTADEPAEVGGTDLGPNPYDLLLSALGACTSMTLHMYARHKGWPLAGVEVTLDHQRIHARDCEHCESESGQISRLRGEITLTGELSEERRQRLLEIAHRCPVHRTLKGEIDIPLELR